MGSVILVVDDDRELVDLIRLCLKPYGYQVFAAFNGSAAFAMVAHVRPDLITLDILMPSMDGWEVCRRLSRATTAPILILSAQTSLRDVKRALAHGADDYLAKPFSIGELRARIQSLLQRTRPASGAGSNPLLMP